VVSYAHAVTITVVSSEPLKVAQLAKRAGIKRPATVRTISRLRLFKYTLFLH